MSNDPSPSPEPFDAPREVVVRFAGTAEPVAARETERLWRAAADALGVAPDALAEVRARRISFDARRRHRDWRVALDVWMRGERPAPPPRRVPEAIPSPPADAPRVLVVGSGPAGLFCALDLLAAGLQVTLLERGGDVQARRRPLAELNRGHGANPESNYCFGEGGAGTYSDGKLYARSGKKKAIRGVLRTLVDHGADPDILSSWRPHVGSNRLPQEVKGMRETILRGGGTVHFHARVEHLEREDGAVAG
ncbi:MAG: FAD-dependent oxidoreductase, partial [Planctomycetota bacterium]